MAECKCARFDRVVHRAKIDGDVVTMEDEAGYMYY